MKKIRLLPILIWVVLLQTLSMNAQNVDFNLRYNGITNTYEVYAKPATSNATYFVGGGSQISILLPSSVADLPLAVTPVAGGFWSDNSQVYAPAADPDHDFHSIATNGALMNLMAGEESLIFTFTISGGGCEAGPRIFENGSDPNSSAAGMGGGDFENFFANVFDPFVNSWNSNYFNDPMVCPEPPVVYPNPLVITEDSTGTVCMPIFDVNPTDTFTVASCSAGPSNGTATSTVDNTTNTLCVSYTPDAGFTGMDSVCVIVCDISGLCDTISVAVQVLPNLPPSVTEEPPIVIAVPINVPQDSTAEGCTVILDPNVGDTFTATVCVGSPGNGTATPTVDGNGLCIEYTPTAGFSGDDEICIIVCDQTNLCDTISVPVNVIPPVLPVDSTQAPIVVVPTIIVPEDSTTTVCGTIIDPNTDDTFTSTICDQPTNATATVDINQSTNELCITIDPDPGFEGSDSLCVIVCDQTDLCDTINIAIEVLSVNDEPLAINDINVTPIGEVATGNVLINDIDPEGDTLVVNTTPLNVMNGIVTLDSAGNYTFTPDPGFVGTGSFEYEVCDTGSPVKCDTALVEIEVIDNDDPDNNTPLGITDNFTTEEGGSMTANVLANDTDPDGDNLTVNTTPVTDPSNGSVTITATGEVTYTPTAGFTGTDTFEYEVCDDGVPSKCDTVTVTIEVLPDNGTNDLYATDDANSGQEGSDQTGNVTDNDVDPEGGTLTVSTTPLTAPSNGTLVLNSNGTYTYTPDAGFIGNDQFTYQVCDDGSPIACDSATVYMAVFENQEPPLVLTNPIVIPQDSTGTLCVPILDNNANDTFTATLCADAPANGSATATVSGTELCLEFIPDAGFTGTDSICVVVCDQSGLCDTVTAPIVVVPTLPTITTEVPPVVITTTIVVPQDSTTEVCTVILDQNEGDTFTATLCDDSPENGTATPTVSGNELCLEYTSDAGYSGDDEVCVIVCDQNNMCDTILIPVTVVAPLLPVDSLQPPVVVFPPIVTPEDSTITVCGPIIDPNVGDEHDVTICGQPENGTVTASVDNVNNQLCITMNPDPGFNGTDTICVIVCDPSGLCDTLIVPIEILSGNDGPIAVDDINVTPIGTVATGNVLTNDVDPEGDGMEVNTTPLNVMNGTVTIDSAGNYTFTPDPGFTGTGSFEYEVCDTGVPSMCDTALVEIEVIDNADPDNNAPVGITDNFITENGAALTANVLGNDFDLDGDNLTVNTTPVTDPTNGTVTIAANGDVEYTPTAGFVGTDTFEYEVCDDGVPSKCDTVTVNIEILPDNGTNDLYATDDANSGDAGSDQTGNVTDNDVDPEAGTLTVSTTPLTAPTNGTVTLGTDGTYTYTPAAGFVGNDQFTYQVCDDGSPIACDSATVYIAVLEVQQPPVVYPNPIVVTQDSTATVCMDILDPNAGDTFTATLCAGSPTDGTATLSIVDGQLCVEFTPDAGFIGQDSVCVTVCDQTGLCTEVIVPVTVIEALPPSTTEEPPIVLPVPIVVPEDSTTTVCTVVLDPNVGDTFTASLCVDSPDNGTASATITGNQLCVEYTPDAGFTGSDDVCVIVCDQTNLCDTISFPVTIVPTIDPTDTTHTPIVVITPVVVPEDSTVVTCGTIIDQDVNDTFTATTCGDPANGTATATVDNASNSLCIEFTPDENFFGTDSICVIVCDQTDLCDTIIIPIIVLPVSDDPTIDNFNSDPTAEVHFDENSTAVVVDFNGTDPDGDMEGTGDNDELDWSITGGADATAFTIDDDGMLQFITPPDYENQDTFIVEITITDPDGNTDVQLLTIIIDNIIEDIYMDLKVMLQGALIQSNDGNMRDDLREQLLIPTNEPYTALNNSRFTHVGGGGESTTTAVLAANAGTPDAIVDWIFIELRDAADATSVIRTASAFVQRDGDVVGMDGDSLFISELPDSFFVAIKHRNHLSAMTKNPVLKVNNNQISKDFTTISDAELYTTAGYENLAMTTIGGKRALWAGNTNADDKVKYDGGSTDQLIVSFNVLSHPNNAGNNLNFSNANGYLMGDLNMDGKAKYDGINNDRLLIQNIVLLYPLNSSFLSNFDEMLEQLP